MVWARREFRRQSEPAPAAYAAALRRMLEALWQSGHRSGVVATVHSCLHSPQTHRHMGAGGGSTGSAWDNTGPLAPCTLPDWTTC